MTAATCDFIFTARQGRENSVSNAVELAIESLERGFQEYGRPLAVFSCNLHVGSDCSLWFHPVHGTEAGMGAGVRAVPLGGCLCLRGRRDSQILRCDSSVLCLGTTFIRDRGFLLTVDQVACPPLVCLGLAGVAVMVPGGLAASAGQSGGRDRDLRRRSLSPSD